MAKPKILLVDADLKSRQMLEISLKKAGFTVTSVEEAEKALQLLDTYVPDMIISDIDLAGTMDGFLFVEVLKERGPNRYIPFVFLTKRKEVEDKIRGLELGVEDYLTKPIYLKEVIARARLILDKKRQEHMEQTGPEPLFQGDLSQMSIVDLLQTMEIGGKTGILHLKRSDHEAKLYVSQGRVVHAVCDNLVGERAVYRTLLWADGSFRIEFRKALQNQETIQVSTQGLIMEGMRRIDELERIKEQLPPFETHLAIDSQTILEEHPDRFPAKIENILAEFNGEATLQDVVEALPYDDLESLEIISKLYFQGFLMEVEGPAPANPEAVDVRDEATETKLPPASSMLDTQMLRLEQASRSIEDIKAKARLSAGAAKPPPVPDVEEVGEDTAFELAPPDSGDDERKAAPPPVEEPLPPVEDIVKAAELLEPPRPTPAPAAEPPLRQTAPAPPPSTPGADDRRAAALFDDASPKVPAPPPVAPPPTALPVAKITPMPAAKMRDNGNAAVVERSGAVRAPAARQALAAPPTAQPAPGQGDVANAGVSTRSGKAMWLGLGAAVVLVAAGAVFWLQGRGPAGGGDNDAYALADRANAMAARGELVAARQLALQALELDPNVAAAHLAFARTERELGRSDSAIAAYGKALEHNSALYSARYEQGELRLTRGDDRGMLRRELETMLLEMSPDRHRSLMGDTAILLARIDVDRRAWDDARAALDRAAAFAPDDPRIAVLRSKVPAAEAPAAAAKPAPSPPVAQAKSVAVRPAPAPAPAPALIPIVGHDDGPTVAEQAAALHEKGTVFYRKGYLRDARRTLEEATQLDGSNDEIWVDLGRVLVELGDDRVALTAFQTAGRITRAIPASGIIWVLCICIKATACAPAKPSKPFWS